MPLTSLPLEMLLAFCAFLPESDRASLRNTCRGLQDALPATTFLEPPCGGRRLWEEPLEQPKFLLRLLRDMPPNVKKDLVVCRRCVSIRKRWIRSGDIQKDEIVVVGKEQDMTAYGNEDSVCEGCMGKSDRSYPRLDQTDPLQQAKTLQHMLDLLSPAQRQQFTLCRRCVAILPRNDNVISPQYNDKDDKDAYGETSPPYAHTYTSSDSLCNSCKEHYLRLCMVFPLPWKNGAAGVAARRKIGDVVAWERHPNGRPMTFCTCWVVFRQAAYDGKCGKCRFHSKPFWRR